MRIKSILATTAVVLGLGLGPALAGVPAEAMSAEEMAAVEGKFSFCCTLFSSAGSGDSLLLKFSFEGTSIVAPGIGVHWDDLSAVEAALGGTPTLFVPQAGLGLTPPSRVPQ